ncbi:hypothetical protein D1P53_003037 [Cryptococcus gattii VGV]|nr:hypothetical protein D1P53_003037 [Cryptococcus gattii VGV]
MRKRVSQTFRRVSDITLSALALLTSKDDQRGSSTISYPISPANTSMQSFSVGAEHAKSGTFPHRRFPYETNYDIVSSAVPSESNTSQVDILFSRYNPVSDQSNSALWSLEECNDEPRALANTSQSLQEALSKITHGRLTNASAETSLSNRPATVRPSGSGTIQEEYVFPVTTPLARHRPGSTHSIVTEATEIIDDESIYDAEAQDLKPMTAAYRSSNLAFDSLSEPLMSPVRGNMPIIEFEGVKMNLCMDDCQTSSESEEVGRPNKELTTAWASDDLLEITLRNAGNTPRDLGSHDIVTVSNGNQTLQSEAASSTPTGLGNRRNHISAPLNFVTGENHSMRCTILPEDNPFK